jgi:ABC-type multidrug transport system fused ATPase/permease subunit
MRFNSGAVRFVAVDEPSSALDADGELKLFENLIAARKGKTMVFVTHRFGHLTRYADNIMYVRKLEGLTCTSNPRICRCLKDGVIVEEGSHEQLIECGGEYANLYNIQAAAFMH